MQGYHCLGMDPKLKAAYERIFCSPAIRGQQGVPYGDSGAGHRRLHHRAPRRSRPPGAAILSPARPTARPTVCPTAHLAVTPRPGDGGKARGYRGWWWIIIIWAIQQLVRLLTK